MTKTDKQQQQETALDADLASYACGGVPLDVELSAAPLIEDWYVVLTPAGDDATVLKIRGKIHRYGPPLQNGQGFTTNAVLWFDRHSRFVRTSGAMYQLGRQVGQGDKP
jgi:hypothetical protein